MPTPRSIRSATPASRVVGYGNQGRSWALNLRDSGFDVTSACGPTSTRERRDRRRLRDRASSTPRADADVICILVPDDVIPSLPIAAARPTRSSSSRAATRSRSTASTPRATSGMVAPRMLGPEVRRCYEEGIGFITAVRRPPRRHRHARGPHARGRQGDRRPAAGRDRADADAGGRARPRGRAGAVARAQARQRVVRRR